MISTCKYFTCPICMSSKREKNSTKCKKCKSTHICNDMYVTICVKKEWRKNALFVGKQSGKNRN